MTGKGVNVLRYDWHDAANTHKPTNETIKNEQSLCLTNQFANILLQKEIKEHKRYAGKIQFIGHSAGAAISYLAVGLLQSRNIPVDTLTMLDPYTFNTTIFTDAIRSTLSSQSNFLKSYFASQPSWVPLFPSLKSTFIDSYWTVVGDDAFQPSSVVNSVDRKIFIIDSSLIPLSLGCGVFSQKVSDFVVSSYYDNDATTAAHGAPVNWYQASILDQTNFGNLGSGNGSNHEYGFFWSPVIGGLHSRGGSFIGCENFFDLMPGETGAALRAAAFANNIGVIAVKATDKIFTKISDIGDQIIFKLADGTKHVAVVTRDQTAAAFVIASANVELGKDLAAREFDKATNMGVGLLVRAVDNFTVVKDLAVSNFGRAFKSISGGIRMISGSPTSVSKKYTIPAGASHMTFSYEILQADKDDSLEVFINDEQVYYRLVADEKGKGTILSELINVTKWSGTEARVTFRINSFDGERLEMILHDLAFVSIAEVEEMATFDSDHDQLPDVWESIFLGNLSADGAQDSDGDGLTNLQELQHHTNPNNRDTNGDGIPDSLQDVKDTTPPSTTASTTGTTWLNEWFISGAKVSFHTTDNSGPLALKKTEYSQNGGQTWLNYASTTSLLITTEGSTTVLYRSSDVFGNQEATNTLSVKIVSVKWFLEDALSKLTNVQGGNKVIAAPTASVVGDLRKVISDKTWLDRDHLSWPKGLTTLVGEMGVENGLAVLIDRAGQVKNNIPAATQTLYDDAQTDIVLSDALLAKLSFDKAKTVKAKNAASQKILDSTLARVQKMLDRAAALETSRPQRAVQLYGSAWYISESIIASNGNEFDTSPPSLGGLLSPSDLL